MNFVGSEIEKRRSEMGLTRAQVAHSLGLNPATVFKIERDPAYNVGLSTLRDLETILQVRFEVHMEENASKARRIMVGNDELILHFRKGFRESSLTNDLLGKLFWRFLRGLPGANAVKIGNKGLPCFWDQHAQVSATRLPKTAHQFEFNIVVLPALFAYVEDLGHHPGLAGDINPNDLEELDG